ncbi:hypothetical protein GY45DRAFT_961246 [Cubamyces sp. BRFM 1775]|nr:hypothetical protein GY45DRAFT_961246 [Cubamyces sp. BRFM 1775]
MASPSTSTNSDSASSQPTTPSASTPASSQPPSPTLSKLSLQDVTDEARAEAAKLKAEANKAFVCTYTCCYMFYICCARWCSWYGSGISLSMSLILCYVGLQHTTSTARRTCTRRPLRRTRWTLRYGATARTRV